MRVRPIVLALAAGAALVVPASAAADVRSELSQASAALNAAIDAADNGDAAGLAAGMSANSQHTEQARLAARALHSPKQRARALVQVGWQYEDNLAAYLDEISWVDDDAQGMLFAAFADNLAGRDRTVDWMVNVLRKLPGSAQSRTVAAIAGLESDGDLEWMVETTLDIDILDQIKVLIGPQLDGSIAHMRAVIDRLEALSDRLPPHGRGSVEHAVDEISAELDGLPEAIDGLIGDVLHQWDEISEEFNFGPFCELVGGLAATAQAPFCD
jgi:hypothetical protein